MRNWTVWGSVAAAVTVGVPLLAVRFGVSWFNSAYWVHQWYPEGAYVSNRPVLTFNANAVAVKGVHQNVARFLKAHGLTRSDAVDLRIAAGLHYRHGAVFSFRLPPAKRQRLIRGMKRLRTPAVKIISAGPMSDPHLRSIDPPEPEDDTVRKDLSYLWMLFPYNRLDWWPPHARALERMSIYRAPIDWPQPELEPSICYLFVGPRTDRVYIVADGLGT